MHRYAQAHQAPAWNRRYPSQYVEAYLSLQAVVVDEFLLQRGNNNIFYDIGSDLKLYHGGQVIQNGSNQRLLFLGNNSLSDRMKINMQGNNQTVIVRNIKRQ